MASRFARLKPSRSVRSKVSEPHARTQSERPRKQPIVLRVSELAFRDRVPPVAEIAAVQPHFVLFEPVPDPDVDRVEGPRQRRVLLVEIAVAPVLDDEFG